MENKTIRMGSRKSRELEQEVKTKGKKIRKLHLASQAMAWVAAVYAKKGEKTEIVCTT